MENRKICKECPWKNNTKHNLKFRTYVDKMKSIGKENHACHMIMSDIWGGKSEINQINVCIGSLNNRKGQA